MNFLSMLSFIALSIGFVAFAKSPLKADSKEINYQDPNMKLYRKKSTVSSDVDLAIPINARPLDPGFANPLTPEVRSPAEQNEINKEPVQDLNHD